MKHQLGRNILQFRAGLQQGKHDDCAALHRLPYVLEEGNVTQCTKAMLKIGITRARLEAHVARHGHAHENEGAHPAPAIHAACPSS